MLKYVLFSFFVAGQGLCAAGSGSGIVAPNVNVSGITSTVVMTVTWTGGFKNIEGKLDTLNNLTGTAFIATQGAINTAGNVSATAYLNLSGKLDTLNNLSGTGFIATQGAVNTLTNLTATGFLATQSAFQAGTVATSNTCWICNVTTSATGHGWINTANAKKMIFQVTYALSSDHAAVASPGVTLYVDGSMETASTLPTTDVDPLWNTQIGTIIANAPSIQAISDPPNAVRFRLSGVFTATASVRYKLVF